MNVNMCRDLVLYMPVWKGSSAVFLSDECDEIPPLIPLEEQDQNVMFAPPLISIDSTFRLPRSPGIDRRRPANAIISLERGERWDGDHEFMLNYDVACILQPSYDISCWDPCMCACHKVRAKL
ncbi:hypothetical protein B0H13DRAFT_2342684 [Mycena leptocephala]|nr:hypothetical protein B0H13DRAFT_2342684 [Mycena leptocephala]